MIYKDRIQNYYSCLLHEDIKREAICSDIERFVREIENISNLDADIFCFVLFMSGYDTPDLDDQYLFSKDDLKREYNKIEAKLIETKTDIFQKVLHDSISKYKSLDHPDYGFVKQALENQEYQPLIENLKSAGLVLKEDTDTNYMACRYVYFSKGKKTYSLYLSFVGKYALLLSKDKGKFRCFLETDKELNGFEHQVINIIRKHEVALLDFDFLETPVEFSPGRIVEYDASKIFNLLFSDDIPPWK